MEILMRNAYALLGVLFIIVFGGAYILLLRSVEAPSPHNEVLPATNREKTMSLSLTSSAFTHNSPIPDTYTCDGSNTPPPLAIDGVPEGTQSLVLVMDDPDIPQEVKDSMGIESYDHWVVYNIPPDTTRIADGASVGELGYNSAQQPAYTGPCPPVQYEPTTHRYSFRLYALPEILRFEDIPTLLEVETAAKAIALESAELIGTYSRVTE